MLMRRTAVIMAVALALAACGGDDDAADGSDELPEASETTEADEPADEPAEEPAEEPADDGQDTDSGSSGGTIRSLDDIPERCKDLMADYLRDIEPVVSSIDWSTATLADFETIAADFETMSEEFDVKSVEAACDDLDFEQTDEGLAMLIEFADDVAPDTVPFFRFIESMATAVAPGDAATPGGDAFETCDDAIATLEEWMDQYDSFTEIPVDQLMKFSSLGSVIMTCTPEQMEFLDRPDVSDFMSGN